MPLAAGIITYTDVDVVSSGTTGPDTGTAGDCPRHGAACHARSLRRTAPASRRDRQHAAGDADRFSGTQFSGSRFCGTRSTAFSRVAFS